MADFAEWIVACSPALPFSADEFLDAYVSNRRGAMDLSLDGDPIAEAIFRIESFEGTASELLSKLSDEVSEEVRRSKTWPKSARALGGLMSDPRPRAFPLPE